MNYCPTQFFASKRSIVFTFLSSLLTEAARAGEVEFAQSWKFDQVSFKTKKNLQLGVKSSSNINIAMVK